MNQREQALFDVIEPMEQRINKLLIEIAAAEQRAKDAEEGLTAAYLKGVEDGKDRARAQIAELIAELDEAVESVAALMDSRARAVRECEIIAAKSTIRYGQFGVAKTIRNRFPECFEGR